MARDLGAVDDEVHVKARELLGFWFKGLMPEQHFTPTDGLDAELTARFGRLRDAVLADGANAWRGEPETLLAAIVLLDQVSRNIHRGSAEAFAADRLAQELACLAIDRGWDARLSAEARRFLYMPLMHAEDRDLQRLCIDKFIALGMEEPLRYARDHAEVIERFGRFPTRNAALGRASTPQETEYLSRPGVGWERPSRPRLMLAY